MKSNLKIKFAALLLAASLIGGAVPAKRAQAGVFLTIPGVAGMFEPVCKECVVVGGFLFFSAGILAVTYGVMTANPLLIVLDGNGSVPERGLAQDFSERYSCIEDREVFSGLASLVKSKAEAIEPVDGQVLVSVTREEIEELMAPTDAMETCPDDVERMIEELK